ncbi:MAG TPA: hypothetical protein VM286_06075 [Candidatus Thermoplasmatota archaeon]|nr:hypothetical protein [Candidatus Thermoplasmatota archaeon]
MTLLAGCVSPATTGSTVPTATELLKDYRPKSISLIEIYVNSSIERSFPSSFYPEHFAFGNDHFEASAPFGQQDKTLTLGSAPSLWLVQDHDRVILGHYRLMSNLHDIALQERVVGNATEGTTPAYVGGLEFRFRWISDTRVMVYVGPYNLGSYGIELQQSARQPAGKRILHLDHDSILPLLNETATVVYSHQPVKTTVTILYWGLSRAILEPSALETLNQRPWALQAELDANADHFLPKARYGQISPMCGPLILKVHATCMNPWEHPLV